MGRISSSDYLPKKTTTTKRPTYIPGYTPTNTRGRPTLQTGAGGSVTMPKSATPLRTTTYDSGGSVKSQTVYTPSKPQSAPTPARATRGGYVSAPQIQAGMSQARTAVSNAVNKIASSVPQVKSSSRSRSRSSSRSSSGSWMDKIAEQATVNPARIAQTNQEMLQFMRPSNLGNYIAGAGALKAGGMLLKAGLSQAPRVIPFVTAAGQQVSQKAPQVTAARPGVPQVVSNAVSRGGQAATSVASRFGPQISQVGRIAGGVAGPTSKGLLKGTLVPAAVAGAGLGILGSQGVGTQPQLVKPQIEVADQGIQGPLSSTRSNNYSYQGTYDDTQNTMTPNVSPGNIGPETSTDESGMILPGINPATTGVPPTEVAPPPEIPPEMPPEYFNYQQELAQINELFQGVSQQNSVLMTKLSEQLLGQLDTLEAQLRQQYQQQGTELDPATLAALKEIRGEVDRRRQLLMEEMNRRGLLQSGIWLEEENRILSNQLTTEEKLLASRVADIQNRMTDALLRLGQERINTMGQLASNQMQNSQWLAGQQISAMQNLQSRNDQWNQWWQGQLVQQRQDAESRRRWDVEQGLERAKTVAGWTGTVPEGYPGAGQQTVEARKSLLQSRSANANAATRTYINYISGYQSLNEALNEFNQFKNEMIKNGADLQAILSSIYAYFGAQ